MNVSSKYHSSHYFIMLLRIHIYSQVLLIIEQINYLLSRFSQPRFQYY